MPKLRFGTRMPLRGILKIALGDLWSRRSPLAVTSLFLLKPIDIYIGRRYNEYIGSRYIDKLHKGDDIMQNQALTEAVYYILLSLTEPLHGYGIMQNTLLLSKGRVNLAAGTLYGAINTLIEKGWIRALPEEKDSRKKEYIITNLGREVLIDEMKRLEELLKNGKRILGGVYNEEGNS